jgi:hypothetical protein
MVGSESASSLRQEEEEATGDLEGLALMWRS